MPVIRRELRAAVQEFLRGAVVVVVVAVVGAVVFFAGQRSASARTRSERVTLNLTHGFCLVLVVTAILAIVDQQQTINNDKHQQ